VRSALVHTLGVTLAQQAVPDTTSEITAVETLWEQVVLAGRVVIRDAQCTQTHVTQTMVEAGGDDVMIVKDNQPELRSASELVFPMPPWGDGQKTDATRDLGHGRLETRTCTTSDALMGLRGVAGLTSGVSGTAPGQLPKAWHGTLGRRVWCHELVVCASHPVAVAGVGPRAFAH
jgi:hypothetical protein